MPSEGAKEKEEKVPGKVNFRPRRFTQGFDESNREASTIEFLLRRTAIFMVGKNGDPKLQPDTAIMQHEVPGPQIQIAIMQLENTILQSVNAVMHFINAES